MGTVTKFEPKNPVAIRGDLLVETIRITPTHAARWLKECTLNRPLQQRHVRGLAKQMKDGEWALNGETIKISDNEEVLDGQHRLHACVDSGVPFKSMVVYGVKKEAFVTIDTGRNRSGGDVLSLHFPDAPRQLCSYMGTACRWVWVIEHGITTKVAQSSVSNYTILDYGTTKPELWRCVDKVRAYPTDMRLLSVPAGGALFYLMQQIDWEEADKYMSDIYGGEGLRRDQAAYSVRGVLSRDRNKMAKMQTKQKMMVVIKGWNAIRAKKKKVLTRDVVVRADEPTPRIKA